MSDFVLAQKQERSRLLESARKLIGKLRVGRNCFALTLLLGGGWACASCGLQLSFAERLHDVWDADPPVYLLLFCRVFGLVWVMLVSGLIHF